MERVLVSMRGANGAWEALARGIALAKRIDARLHVLHVIAVGARSSKAPGALDRNMKRRLELCIESAKAEGIRIEYFVVEGAYEEEVIRFVENHRITLLVAETSNGDGRACERESLSLLKIRHRISCRVELVSPRKIDN